jgi:hypothetical protein
MTPLRPGKRSAENEAEHNPYKAANRIKKVYAMVQVIDLHLGGAYRGQYAELADSLEAMPGTARMLIASVAGVRGPSPETWRDLVKVFRARAENNPKPVVYPALEVVR